MKTNNGMTAREILLLDALKEAFEVITAQNDGNCTSSVVSAIGMLDAEWLKKHGWNPK